MSGNRKRVQIEAHVARYFQDHSGSDVWIDDLVAHVCEKNGIPHRQSLKGNIQSVVSRCLQNKSIVARVAIRGTHWIPGEQPIPPSGSVGKVMEVIRDLKDGALLLESEDGKLYRAKEVPL